MNNSLQESDLYGSRRDKMNKSDYKKDKINRIEEVPLP